MTRLKYFAIHFFFSLFFSCEQSNKKSDAYGNFEAKEIVVSAEASGKILKFDIEEGQQIEANKIVGVIDSLHLFLKKEQLLAARTSLASKSKNILSQINILKEQQRIARKEQDRVIKLLNDGVATQKQFDDLSGSLSVLEKQIVAIETQNIPVLSELKGMDFQIEQLNDQLRKCSIINPIKGTVLTKLAEPSEITVYGKPLYKIAYLDEIYLRVYVSGDQLGHVKIGNEAEVLIDESKNSTKKMKGTISWISSNAEFTPKIIQTKEERVNLVYAVKIRVQNDGSLKIGMPGEVLLLK